MSPIEGGEVIEGGVHVDQFSIEGGEVIEGVFMSTKFQ